MMKKFVFINILSISYFCLHAQDPLFTQPGGATTYNNPSFTGGDTISTAFISYRNQWPKLEGNLQTFVVGFNQYLTGFNSYLGAMYMRDVSGALTNQRISFIYAQNIPLSKKNKKIFLRPALEVTYFQKELDWNNLSFGDMIDPRRGYVYQTGDVPRGGMVSNIDFSAGTLFFWDEFSFGLSVHHFTEPNESLITGNSPLPMKFGAQAAYDVKIKPMRLVITPYLWHYTQANFQQSMAGLNYKFIGKHSNYIFGGSYRLKDAVNFMLGFEHGMARIFYSYDITVNGLGQSNTGGSHEISLLCNFWKVRAAKRWRGASSVFI